MNFDFNGYYQAYDTSVTYIKTSFLTILFLLENQTKTVENEIFQPFHTQSDKRGAKLRLS